MRFALVFLVGLTFTAGACGDADPTSSDGGQGGTAGAGGATCQQLMTAYANASNLAIVCDPTAANQCLQQTLPPDCTGCARVVQDATGPDAIRAQLIADGCTHPIACPCISPGPVTCMATDGGAAAGTCTAAPLN